MSKISTVIAAAVGVVALQVSAEAAHPSSSANVSRPATVSHRTVLHSNPKPVSAGSFRQFGPKIDPSKIAGTAKQPGNQNDSNAGHTLGKHKTTPPQGKFDTSKPGAGKFDPTKLDPSRLGKVADKVPGKIDPSKIDPSKVDPSKTNPTKPDPTKTGNNNPTPMDPTKTGNNNPAPTDPTKIGDKCKVPGNCGGHDKGGKVVVVVPGGGPYYAPTYVPAPAYMAPTSAPVYSTRTVPAPSPVAARNCLIKEYSQRSGVVFKDTCTNEWAVNAQIAKDQVARPTGVCVTKEYVQTGAVLFKDVCTGEWAVNPPADQQTQAQPTTQQN
jgi:hypothetical protein